MNQIFFDHWEKLVFKKNVINKLKIYKNKLYI